MSKGGGAGGEILRSIGEIALNALQSPRQETRMTLLQGEAMPPPRSLRANEEYVRVRLMAAHLPYTRKLLTTYEPLVYAGVALGETAQENAEFAKAVSSGHSTEGLRGADRATLSEVTLMEPSPYLGSLSLAVGLISVRSSERARKLMERVRELSEKAAAPLIGDAAKAVGALANTLELLTLDGSYVEVGLMTSKPSLTTGYYALYADRGRKDEDVKFDFREGRLVDAATGKNVSRPYIVLSIEGVDRRPDAAKIPRIRKAMERVLAVIDGGGYTEEAVRGVMREYADAVTFCPDLLPVDRDYLIDAATRRFADFRRTRQLFESTRGLESAAGQTRPAIPTVEDVVADALEQRFGPHNSAVQTAARQNKLAGAVRRLQASVREGDFAALGDQVRECLDAIRSDAPPIDPGLIKEVLLCLRRVRRYDDMKAVVQACDRADLKRPLFMRLHAQALIELGDAAAAEPMLKQAEDLARRMKDDTERGEIFGLLGRIQKDRFVALAHGRDKRARQNALTQAINFYREGERISNIDSDFYHAVNWMALAHAGRAAGLRVGDAGKITRIARRILDYVDSRYPNTQPWDAANAAEASLALGHHAEAEKWLDRYVMVAHGDSFALNSTLRQVTTLWGIGPDHKHAAIVQALQLAALGTTNAATRVNPTAARQLMNRPLPPQRLEALFSGEAGMAVERAYKALGLSRFVGKVLYGQETALGTGFLVRASDLLPGGPDADAAKSAVLKKAGVEGKWLFLTNAHVISTTGEANAIPPEEALVEFQMADPARKYRVKRLLWSSPINEHDCTVLELSEYPAFADDAAPALAANLPRRAADGADTETKSARARVLVLGHPQGRKLEITFDNNLLIDHDGPDPGGAFSAKPVRVHYRAPTEGGSSGSPVFNAQTLELLAIHHMGNVPPLRPGISPEGYQANQGKSLRAIAYAFEAFLKGGGARSAPAAAPASAPQPASSSEASFESLHGYADFERGPALETMSQRSTRRLAPVCADFIASFEISSPAFYRKRLQAPCWPGGASGLTIGVGYDLRHASADEFQADWKDHIPAEVVDRLLPFCLLAEDDPEKRKAAVKSLSDIVIPIEAAMKVYNEVMIPIQTFRTERCFENTAELNDLCMGALVSLVFNRGPGLGAADSRREMRSIAAHMKARDFAKVPAEIRAMKRIWEGQEKLRGLCTRRDREAALFEDGLKQTAALVA